MTMTKNFKGGEYFTNLLKQKDVSAGIAAIETLKEAICFSNATTVQGLKDELKGFITEIRNTNYSVAAINSGCELFMRFITLSQLDNSDFNECKITMLKRGDEFIVRIKAAKDKISMRASQLIIADDLNILTHSRSRVVLSTFIEAAKAEKHFHVYVTRSEFDENSGYSGQSMCEDLTRANIPNTLILDSAIGYIMEKVDIVMVGAEAVAESGGIINRIGSFTMALCAREMKKPFYVLAESFKFSRLFPLSPSDLPDEYKYVANIREKDLSKQDPSVDYTPPSYITLLFTDLGVLTPSAVSDELIKLYL